MRVDPAGPDELLELSSAFNALGTRIAGMIEHERELVAELSHRLRNPLTRLRLRIEQVDDASPAAQLTEDVDELTRVVTGLIEDARGSARPSVRWCDLAEVVADRADFWAVLPEDQRTPWSVATIGGPLQVPLPKPELEAALDVLLENVFRHTDDDVAVEAKSNCGSGCSDQARLRNQTTRDPSSASIALGNSAIVALRSNFQPNFWGPARCIRAAISLLASTQGAHAATASMSSSSASKPSRP